MIFLRIRIEPILNNVSIVTSSLVQNDVYLHSYTTLKLGGRAQFFSIPENVEELQYLLKFAQDKMLDIFILGKGSNLIVRDEGVKGLVINTEKFSGVSFENNSIDVGSGYSLKKLISDTTKRHLSGLESLIEIPASLGGAVYMNAGGKFGNIGSLVSKCWCLKLDDSQLYEVDKSDLKFGYRMSNLERFFIYKIRLNLNDTDEKTIFDNIQKALEYKIKTQPLSTNNAGCVFKNPVGNSAAQLIEQCSLKNYKIGSVFVSHKHSNFFINTGNRADDYIKLIDFVKEEVYRTFGVTLEREVKIWPDEPNFSYKNDR